MVREMYGTMNGNTGRITAGDGDTKIKEDVAIRHDQKCRDAEFLVLFVGCWAAMIAISVIAFSHGNPLRLMYGLDHKGNICGDKHGNVDLRELEVKYFLNPKQVQKSMVKQGHFKLADARVICLMECPSPSEDAINWVCDYPEGDIEISVDDWINRDYDYYEFLTHEMRNSSLQLQGPYYPILFRSVNVYWNCQVIGRASNVSLWHWQQMGGISINEDLLIDEAIHKVVDSRSAMLNRYMADVGKTRPVLVICGIIAPLVLSILWLLMIRYFVAVITWITVILFNVLVVYVTFFSYRKASEVMRRVEALVIFPILPCLVLAMFYIFWFSAIHYLISSGKVLPNMCDSATCCAYDLKLRSINCHSCCGYSIHYIPHITMAVLFHFFGFYWVTHFIHACSSCVVAGSVASYYWDDGALMHGNSFLRIFFSMKQLFRYSLGSVALGSLILPVVGCVCSILEFICRRLKLINPAPVGIIEKFMLQSYVLCVRCVNWARRSVNHNAYVMIAAAGKGFFKASSMAADVIMGNILQIEKVNVIGDMIIFLGKLCISFFCAGFAFIMLDAHKYKSAHNRISSPLLPVLVCFLLGYIFANLFYTVVEMSIDTLILSFCQDSVRHLGTAKYAPQFLLEILNRRAEGQRDPE